MTEYRVTRPQAYFEGTPASRNPSLRQGYYCEAGSPEQAALEIAKRVGAISKNRECVLHVQPRIEGVSFESLKVIYFVTKKNKRWEVTRTIHN